MKYDLCGGMGFFSVSNYFEMCFFAGDKMGCLFRVGCQAGFICFLRFVRMFKFKVCIFVVINEGLRFFH